MPNPQSEKRYNEMNQSQGQVREAIVIHVFVEKDNGDGGEVINNKRK